MTTVITDRGLIIGELRVVPHKVLFYLLVIFLFTSGALYFYTRNDENTPSLLFLYGVPLLIVLALNIDKFIALIKSPRLTRYDNGIHFKDGSFWPNEVILIEKIDTDLLVLAVPAQNIPLSKKSLGAQKIRFNKDTNHHHIEFSFPAFTTNQDIHKFFGPVEKTTIERPANSKKLVSQLVFGTPNPRALHYICYPLLFLCLGAVFYSFFTRNFFPTQEWADKGWLLSLPATAILSIWLFLNNRREKKKNPVAYAARIKNNPINPSIALLGAPFMIFCFVYIVIVMALPALHARYTGRPLEKLVTYEEKDFSSRTGYHLESAQLGTGFLKELRVDERHYRQLPDQGQIIVFGKQTPLGFHLTGYRLHTRP